MVQSWSFKRFLKSTAIYEAVLQLTQKQCNNILQAKKECLLLFVNPTCLRIKKDQKKQINIFRAFHCLAFVRAEFFPGIVNMRKE